MPRITLQNLEQIHASEIRKQEWGTVLKRLRRSTYGALAITINGKARGVLLTAEEYERLLRLAFPHALQDEEVLDSLRHEWDKRLSILNEPGTADRMRRAATEPLDIDGKFHVDDSH